MIYKIDTESMIEMASLSSSSSVVINEVAELTNTIITHDDWYCRQKLTIDEHIKLVKDNSKALQEDFEDYSTCIKEIVDDILSFIQSEEQEFASLEADIGSFLSMMSGNSDTTSYNGSNTANVCNSVLSETKGIDAMNTVASATSPIQMVNFSSFSN